MTVEPTWEYTEVTEAVTPAGTERLVLQLNALGSLGWEVVGALSASNIGPNTNTAILKRCTMGFPAPVAEGPGWATDPTGRFERRYWDGLRWTEHVTTGTTTDTDYPNRRS